MGFALHVAAVTWCCRNLTDGFLPYARCNALLDLSAVNFDQHNPCAIPGGGSSMSGDTGLNAHVVAARLVEVGLWHSVAGGYELNDFLVYNPSKEEVLSNRQSSKKRTEESRKRRLGNGASNSARNALHDTKSRVSNSAPVPVPVPEKKIGDEPSQSATAPGAAPKAKKPKSSKGRLPEDWEPTPELVTRLRAKFGVDPLPAVSRFRNYWLNATKNALKPRWDLAFENWVDSDASAGKLTRLESGDMLPNIWAEGSEKFVPKDGESFDEYAARTAQ